MIIENYDSLLIEETFLFNLYGTYFEKEAFKHFKLSGNTIAIKILSKNLKKKILLINNI